MSKLKNNPAQEEAINSLYGQFVIIACPGSGKTTTILRRIHHILENGEVEKPSEIVMLTFTKAAADEMKERYVSMYGSNPGVVFCTIHSFCVALLKKFKGLNPDNIISNNYNMLLEIILNSNQVDKISDVKTFVKAVQMDITVVKNNNLDVNEYEPKCCEDKEYFLSIFNAYETHKDDFGWYDFDDILIMAYDLLKTDEEVYEFARRQYGYIHVDEYQDTNPIQRDIIYEIAGQNGFLTVVGDDDQSIYAFRGARPEIMQDFSKHYTTAKTIYMSTNYRSDKKIIDVASKLIKKNSVRFDKDIMASSEEEGSVSVKSAGTKKDELLLIAGDILSLHNKSKVEYDDIAVLYRNNAQAEALANVLWQLNIPFYSNEDDITNRYNHPIFYDMLSYNVMAHKENYSPEECAKAFYNTIRHPNRFYGNGNDLKYTDSIEEMKKKVYNPNLESWKNENSMDNVESYHRLIKSLKFLPLARVLDTIYTVGGYREYLQYMAEYNNVPFEELEEKWQMYKNDIERNNIKTFEEWENYGKKVTYMLETTKIEKKGVCLSTMHKSKGCEWDNVLIMDCVEKVCPFYKATLTSEIEEERRLFYVAMTRAKHTLNMYYYKPSRQKPGVKPSRFLSEAGLL